MALVSQYCLQFPQRIQNCLSSSPPKLSVVSLSKTTSSSTKTNTLSLSSSPSQCQVVVTRERGKNDKLINALARHGIDCLELPLIQHANGPDLDKLPSILVDKSFAWVIITSPEAALVFLDAWRAAGTPKVRLAVVGVGTASVFKKESAPQLLDISFIPSKATGKVLALELPKVGSNKCTVLYPASVKASHEIEIGLSDRGFQVTRLNTYTTVTVSQVDQMILKEALSTSVVAVASPSAIRSWVKFISEPEQWTNSVACIGETTALAAKKSGLRNVYYPTHPGLEGWVDCILDALSSHAKFQSVK